MAAGIIISGTSSNSGKTTVSIGLMRALFNSGKKVAPFKCGPDYIDSQFHRAATHRDSINLDLFMASTDHIRQLYHNYSNDADIAVIEGVMGLYDGYDGERGSVAEIAKTLNLPVILVIDAASTGYSSAAIISGFMNFDPEVKVLGVIFNKVASSRHLKLLLKACATAGIECLGYVLRNKSLEKPSRHLGLALSSAESMEKFSESAAQAMAEHINLNRIVEISKCGDIDTEIYTFDKGGNDPTRPKFTIAVAKDEAFSFVYPENLRSLGKHPRYRIEIIEFSPLNDPIIPDADMLYIPGGYPELYGERLSANTSMLKSINQYANGGGYILAECGGMMYLGHDIDGYQMCDVLPLSATMKNAKLKIGYRNIMTESGLPFKGHEFHYSSVHTTDTIPSIATQTDIEGRIVDTPLYKMNNVIAGYTHLYWGETDVLRLFDI